MKFENDYAVASIGKRNPLRNGIEAVIISILLLCLFAVIRPADPFALTGPFPWICLAPLFCSLFYGTVYGLISWIIVMGYLFMHPAANVVDPAILGQYFAGMASITFLAGLFSSYWQSQLRHNAHLNQYVRQHLEDLSRDYYLLRVSHDRIEHSFIVKPLSWRDAFVRIRKVMQENNCEINFTTSQEFLNIFCQYCSITSAVFCLYNDKDKQLLPMANVGQHFDVDLQDPLVEHAINKTVATYLAVNTLTNLHNSQYLVVVPLMDNQSELIGFIVIKEIPFWSLTHDNMEVLSVFAAVYGSMWSTMQHVKPLLDAFPAFPPEFLREYQTLLSLNKDHNVESYISALLVPESEVQESIVYQLSQQNRTLDSGLCLPCAKGKLVLKILPLTNVQGMLGYQNRLQYWLKSYFSLNMNTEGLYFRFLPIGGDSVLQQLNNFLNGFDYVDE